MSFKVGDKVYRVRDADCIPLDVRIVSRVVSKIVKNRWFNDENGVSRCYADYDATPEKAWERFIERERLRAEAAQARLAEVLAMPMPPVEDG